MVTSALPTRPADGVASVDPGLGSLLAREHAYVRVSFIFLSVGLDHFSSRQGNGSVRRAAHDPAEAGPLLRLLKKKVHTQETAAADGSRRRHKSSQVSGNSDPDSFVLPQQGVRRKERGGEREREREESLALAFLLCEKLTALSGCCVADT